MNIEQRQLTLQKLWEHCVVTGW